MGSSLYDAPTSHLGTILELCKGHTEGTWLVSEHFWNHPEANPSPGKKGHSCPNFPGGSKDTLRRRAVIMGPLGIVILGLSWLVLGYYGANLAQILLPEKKDMHVQIFRDLLGVAVDFF